MTPTATADDRAAAARAALQHAHGDYADRAGWLARLAELGIATPDNLTALVDTVETIRAELDKVRATRRPDPAALAAQLAGAKNRPQAISKAVERITTGARTAETEKALTDLLKAAEKHAAGALGATTAREQLIALLQPLHADQVDALTDLLNTHPTVAGMDAETAIAADLAATWQQREHLTGHINTVEALGADIRGRGPKGRFERVDEAEAALWCNWDQVEKLRNGPAGDLIYRANKITAAGANGAQRGPLPTIVEGTAAGAVRRLRGIAETLEVLDQWETEKEKRAEAKTTPRRRRQPLATGAALPTPAA